MEIGFSEFEVNDRAALDVQVPWRARKPASAPSPFSCETRAARFDDGP